MTKVLIADDHAIVRRGLKQILEETSDIQVEDEAASGQEAFDKVMEKDYDVVILDISMPNGSGLDILQRIKSEKPELPVLILSIHPEEQYAIRALRDGASGYLTKESAPDELIEAIRRISRGRKYVSSSLAEKLASTLHSDSEKLPHELLSNREFQVLCEIARGKSLKDIADTLHLSSKTISTYRSRILEKIQVKNNAELILYAIRNKLV